MKRFSKVRYNQDEHHLKFKDKESVKSFNLNDVDDLKRLESFLNRLHIGEPQSISDYIKRFEDKRYHIEFDEERYYVIDKDGDIVYLFETDEIEEAVSAANLLNKQHNFISDLIKFMQSKGFADEDFKEFTEEVNEINEENPIIFNDSESIDDLLSKYVKNKRFYYRYDKGHYYILDRKQDSPSIYVNTITDAICVVNYLNKQDNTKEDGWMNNRFSLKLGRFYDYDKILQHEEVLKLLNESHTEIINLLADLTKFKLVMIEIIEDLEKGEGNEKYVEWIKENVNITF